MAANKKPYLRSVVTDRVDLRDRLYQPAVATAPSASWNALERYKLPVLDQGQTNACTGFSLANVVRYLMHSAGRTKDATAGVAPFMLYSMARRYDEFPGSTDVGSSLRGAMKGWHKHGACSAALWQGIDMPDSSSDPASDWWQDAVRRPLGAYYRVDTRSITDMHVALNEVGVLYASAACHDHWDLGFKLSPKKRSGWKIPPRKAGLDDGGHAFVIVGYNADGFLILNSWGERWGDGGVAVLDYEDWLDNAMDCWVAQLGVVTEQHQSVAQASTLRVDRAGHVALATDLTLRAREIAPFIVDMENNGSLSKSGLMRTNEGDLRDLVTRHLQIARQRWGLGATGKVDIAVYAHGGLTGEVLAHATASTWIPALYDAQIFPIFFMWETDAFSTIKNRLSDLVAAEPRTTGGVGERIMNFWNERLERLFNAPGTMLWSEMKQNAEQITKNPEGGAATLLALSKSVPGFCPSTVRLHLIGHSAGSIVHSHLASRLVSDGWEIGSMQFMAPAVRTDVFAREVVPHLQSRKVKSYVQYHLTEKAELEDPTCKALLGYSRSLLYLVSRSFEGSRATPILGMAKYQNLLPELPNARFWDAPSERTAASTHGGFDNDAATLQSVIKHIQSRRPAPRAIAR